MPNVLLPVAPPPDERLLVMFLNAYAAAGAPALMTDDDIAASNRERAGSISWDENPLLSAPTVTMASADVSPLPEGITGAFELPCPCPKSSSFAAKTGLNSSCFGLR